MKTKFVSKRFRHKETGEIATQIPVFTIGDWEELSENQCIGCGGDLHPETAMNALSRYGHGYICSECGRSEALEGDFINQRDNPEQAR